MARSFGGGQDYSGTFASLANADLSIIKGGTTQAVNQAKTDQAAIDKDTYSKWTNGKISDEAWLAYIQTRLTAAGGDPTEQEYWANLLRENQTAIGDSQMETKFKQGKVSAQGLLSYYRSRMTKVEQNSPAYRDIADRYQQLVDFVHQGGGSSGGSGGGGGGGGGGASGLAAAINKAGQTRTATTQGQGLPYDSSGPDVIPALSTYYGVGSVNFYLKTLQGDQDRLKNLFDQHKKDATLGFVTDNVTGQQVPTDPETLRALDAQYLRNQDAMATVYDAKGDPKGATAARTEKGTHISNYMVDHNTDRLMTPYLELQKSITDSWQAASALSPEDRLQVYRQTADQVKAFENGMFPGEGGFGLKAYLGNVKSKDIAGQAVDNASGRNLSHVVPWTESLPPELRPAGDVYEIMQGWDNLHRAVLDPNLSPEERQMLIGEAERLIPGPAGTASSTGMRSNRGMLNQTDIHNLAYGDPNYAPDAIPKGNSVFKPDYVGPLATLEQKDGLDNRDPAYGGPRFVWSLDESGKPAVVPADAVGSADGASLYLVPQGADRSTLIQVGVKVGGRTVTAYAAPHEIAPNLLPSQMRVYRATNPITDDAGRVIVPAGSLIPSAVIAGKGGMDWINRQIRIANVAVGSAVHGVQIQSSTGGAPILWYQDEQTGLLSSALNLDNSEIDTVTGGLAVGADGHAAMNNVPFRKGSPMAFGDGFSLSEMVNVVQGRVGSGELNLSDFGTAGSGLTVGPPPTLDDITRALMGPVKAHGPGSWHANDGKALKDNLDSARQADANQWTAEQRKAFSGTPAGKSFDAISGIAKTFGITIPDVSPSSLGQQPSRGNQPQQDPALLARMDALSASRMREGVGSTFLPPIPVKRASLPAIPRQTAPVEPDLPLPPLNLGRPGATPDFSGKMRNL